MNGSDTTMGSNCSFKDVDLLMQYVELVIYVPVFVFGLIVNIAALYVLCISLSKWKEQSIYMSNLALMDLLLLFPLPFKMHATNHKWPATLLTFCSVLESLYFAGIYGSIYTIVCIALDRWVAICYPLKAKTVRSPAKAVWICVGVWVLVLALVFPNSLHFRKPDKTDEGFHCFHSFSEKGWSPPVIICLQLFGFLGPALVVIYCSVCTRRVLRQPGQQSTLKRVYMKIIYSSLCAFLLPFTPSHVAILLQFLVRQGMIEDCSIKIKISFFLQFTMCLSNITCCLDAPCYYFIAHEGRQPEQGNPGSPLPGHFHLLSRADTEPAEGYSLSSVSLVCPGGFS